MAVLDEAMKKLVIIGASGHGKVIADIALRCGYDEVVFLDDNPAVKNVGEYVVLGASSLVGELATEGYDFVVGIGNASIRLRIQNELVGAGCKVVSMVHPSAEVAYDTTIGTGTVVMAGSVIGTGAVIGDGCVINTSAVVGCDDVIGDFAHVSVGAKLGDGVEVGSRVWVGIGARVLTGVKICGSTTIGAGALVDRDLEEAGTYVGVPVRLLRS